jgi:hypothetical protein
MGISDWLFGGTAGNSINTQGANGAYAQDYLRNQLGSVGGRQAPQTTAAQLGAAAQLNGGPQDQARAQQQQTAGFLQGIMQGNRAGAGELAVNRQVGQATAAQQAAARMARGANAALAARNAARNTADISLSGAGQAAQAQMQDQNAAAGQLGGLLQGMRGQDIDFAGQNAQLAQQRMLQQGAFDQQTGLANQDARLRQMGMNDQASQNYLAQLLGMDQATFQRELAKQQMNAQDKGALGGLLQGAAGIGMTYATGGFGGGPLFGGAPKPKLGNDSGLMVPGSY